MERCEFFPNLSIKLYNSRENYTRIIVGKGKMIRGSYQFFKIKDNDIYYTHNQVGFIPETQGWFDIE